MTAVRIQLGWMALLCIALTGCVSTTTNLSAPAYAAQPERFVVVTLRNGNGPAVARAGSTMRDYDTIAQYSAAPATRSLARAIATAHSLREITAWPIALLDVHCLVYELPPGVAQSKKIEELRRDRRIESVQPLQQFDVLGQSGEDPYRKLQRSLDVMRVSEAHAWSRGEGIRLAVVDTGVDANHPDLAGRVVKNRDFVNNGATQDVTHGTAVAGVIAALDNNLEGIVGVAPAATLFSFRACWSATTNPVAVCNTLTLAKALSAAIEARADIVNLSLSGPSDPLLARLVEVGLRRGIVFVGAVPPGTRGPSFPTDIAGTIKVAATGPLSADQDALIAPGIDVLTLAPAGRYDFLSGNSLATANVAGGIALLLAREPKLGAQQAYELLTRSMQLNEAATIDVCAALTMLSRTSPCPAQEAQTNILRSSQSAQVERGMPSR